MIAYLLEWASLLIRWAHVIVGVAWIGASFYFVWLESHLEREGKKSGIAGDLWAIHGGGFYFVQKYKNAPEQLPENLHWFKWEAYFTWITGFLLLCVVYYANASSYLVDINKVDIAPWLAIAASLGFGVVGFLGYHLLCETAVGKNNRNMFVVMLLLITLLAFLMDLMFQDRAVYLQIGALLGTMMAGNVFFVIIPNQKKAVGQMIDGKEPDPSLGQQALRRSLHNNYFTLPVIFLMISNHYPMTFGHSWNWLILIIISLIGVGIRHWFNLKNQGKAKQGSWSLIAAMVGLVALIVLMAPKDMSAGETVEFADVRIILDKHCISCHASKPTSEFFKIAPMGVMLDDDIIVKAIADKIKQQAVLSNNMPRIISADETPLMTDAEREVLGRWIDQGANL